MCLPANLGTAERYTPSSRDEIVRFSGLEVQSAFFKEHVPAAAFLCYVSYSTRELQRQPFDI
jgi:hypothetical protein